MAGDGGSPEPNSGLGQNQPDKSGIQNPDTHHHESHAPRGANFSMAHALDIIRKRKENQQKEQEEKQLALEEERKAKAKEKRLRRRQNQKERRKQLKSDGDSATKPSPSEQKRCENTSNELMDPQDGGIVHQSCSKSDTKMEKTNDVLSCNIDDGGTTKTMEKKRRTHKVRKRSKKIIKNTSSDQVGKIDKTSTQLQANELTDNAKKLRSLIPRTLLIKKRDQQ